MKNLQYHPSIQKKADGTFSISVTTSWFDGKLYQQGIDSMDHHADNLPSFDVAYWQLMSWFPNAVFSSGIPTEWWHYRTVVKPGFAEYLKVPK